MRRIPIIAPSSAAALGDVLLQPRQRRRVGVGHDVRHGAVYVGIQFVEQSHHLGRVSAASEDDHRLRPPPSSAMIAGGAVVDGISSVVVREGGGSIIVLVQDATTPLAPHGATYAHETDEEGGGRDDD